MNLIKGKQIGSQQIVVSGSTGNVIVSGLLDTNGNQVFVNVSPTQDQHLTNKAYVDSVAQGLNPHAPVVVVSINQIIQSTLLTIDGYQLQSGDRVLCAGQTNLVENGLFDAVVGTWARTPDADGTPVNEVQLGDFVFVSSGTTNASSGWVLGKSDTSTSPYIVPGTNTQEWFKMAAPGSYSADGEGIELVGSEFSLELDGVTLTKSGTGLKLNDTLSTSISTNTVNITSLDSTLSSEISATNSDFTSLEEELSTEISIEASTRSSVDTVLSTAISTETSIRTSADTSLSTAISSNDSTDIVLSTAISTETSIRTSADTSLSTALSTEISTTGSEVTSLSTAIDDVDQPEVISETFTPANSGSTSTVVVSTTSFGYGTGVVDVDSVTVYLNGIQYPFAYAVETPVFHTNGTTPTGTNITLYFDGTVAGFAIETDDNVIMKYMITT